ncbi:hypothetical protein C475_17873 [Halosimplex carlsbadense 2-9-1]|uniref:Uncharacterized protein n=1 Tax=Halosimplex carlsbadense 2-9-1 TaxID=797114 RepID=M0CGJ7_9EURY|nr:hypothetical protein [Halosimplex carlsbadense]ELZ22405.1 hypothetical protein C475_17873 [Halosimplex carlsbadense 2-9-1]
MAATNDSPDDTGGSTGLMGQAISFLTEPLGIGLVVGAGIALFLFWRVL